MNSKNSESAKKTIESSFRNRLTFLEQRNQHLHLELKRHKNHINQSLEMPEHYEGLKGNYQQLLDQFERSEAIRREQKELIGEQRTQMGYLE